MLIVSVIGIWIVVAAVMGVWAMRSAGEPPMVECFDCNRNTCAGCPLLEKAKQLAAEDFVTVSIEDQRLAA